MLPETYQFQGPSYLKGRAEGEARGEANGEARAIIAVLEARDITPTQEQRQRILACTDIDRLNTWVRKAVTLTRVDELF